MVCKVLFHLHHSPLQPHFYHISPLFITLNVFISLYVCHAPFSVCSFTRSCPLGLRNVFGIWPFLSFPLLTIQAFISYLDHYSCSPRFQSFIHRIMDKIMPAELLSCKTSLIMLLSCFKHSFWLSFFL